MGESRLGKGKYQMNKCEPTEKERVLFTSLVDRTLAPWQLEQVRTPRHKEPTQRSVLATHWHPEFIPMPIIMERIDAMYPNRQDELIIPTQHNVLMELNGFAGVEVDCFDASFDEKVQLLLHFKAESIREAHTLRTILAQTFAYRATQLYALLEALEQAHPALIDRAVRHSGATAEIICTMSRCATCLRTLIEQEEGSYDPDALKNRLIRDFIDAVQPFSNAETRATAHSYLRAVKGVVKERFDYSNLHAAHDIIAETRALGGCIVIPHPEQFWPVLLADYDVDGIEVWNPQSQRYTEFLIATVNRRNSGLSASDKKTLLFMGDDCHLSEKTRPLAVQDPLKAAREVGLQPAWDHPLIRQHLLAAHSSRNEIITQYRERLLG